MTPDLVRTITTSILALVVVIGGGVLLVIPSQVPPAELLPFVTAVDGLVLGFFFSDRAASASSTRTLQALYTPAPAIEGNHVPTP